MLKIQKIVHQNYYQEIDSIRAIAVLLVVFFHFEMFNFTGGFLGVDIFFVLSGFLITKILSETEKQGFWLLFFFNKRLRRILPALYLVIIISTIFAFVQFTVSYRKISSSIITSTFGISTFFFGSLDILIIPKCISLCCILGLSQLNYSFIYSGVFLLSTIK